MSSDSPRTAAGRIFLLDQAPTYPGAPPEVQAKHDWYRQHVLAIEAEASPAASGDALDYDRLAALLDNDHDRQTDDPGDGSGPAFCTCGRWDASLPLSWGAHIATELRLQQPASREAAE